MPKKGQVDPKIAAFEVPYLSDAGSIEELEAIEGEETSQHLDVLHMGLTVAASVVLLGPIQPTALISSQVVAPQAAHLQRVQEHTQRGEQRTACIEQTHPVQHWPTKEGKKL